MKITKRQLRGIIREGLRIRSLVESYNSMSPAGKSLANSIKRKFMKLYPDAKVGIDGREGWITVNDKKAINMSQASGSPMSDEEMIEKMHAVYAGEHVDSDVPTANSRMGTFREGKRQLRNLVRESIIKEMKPFRMPDSYYDPPDDEIPEAVEAALEDIYDKAASSPNKEHVFSGPDGDYALIDETEAGGDVLPAYILRDPNGGEEQFDIEIQSEMDKLEDLLTDILMQNYAQDQEDFEAEYRSY